MKECAKFGQTDISLAAKTQECAKFRRTLCKNLLPNV